MALYARFLNDQDRPVVRRLAGSRTASHRAVMHARIIERSSWGIGVPDIARDLGVSENTVRKWLHRWNEAGLAGLEDRTQHSGRPPTYTRLDRATILALAQRGGWTLLALTAAVNSYGIPIRRSQLRRICREAKVDWRKEAPHA